MKHALLLAIGLMACGAARAQETDQRTIAATGTGEVRRKPDSVTVYVGAEVRGYDVPKLRALAARRAEAILKAVQAAGVRPEDIQTAHLNVRRDRWNNYTGGENEASDVEGEPVLSGLVYFVEHALRVRTPLVDKAGPIIDTAVGAGANIIQGPFFSVRDEKEPYQQALVLALRDARRNADIIARETGVRITGTVRVGGGSFRSPYYNVDGLYRSGGGFGGGMATFQPSSAGTPVTPGEVIISTSVNVTYRFEESAK